ncbi:unnamed protein product, partial [Trichogramma brassicae]
FFIRPNFQLLEKYGELKTEQSEWTRMITPASRATPSVAARTYHGIRVPFAEIGTLAATSSETLGWRRAQMKRSAASSSDELAKLQSALRVSKLPVLGRPEDECVINTCGPTNSQHSKPKPCLATEATYTTCSVTLSYLLDRHRLPLDHYLEHYTAIERASGIDPAAAYLCRDRGPVTISCDLIK